MIKLPMRMTEMFGHLDPKTGKPVPLLPYPVGKGNYLYQVGDVVYAWTYAGMKRLFICHIGVHWLDNTKKEYYLSDKPGVARRWCTTVTTDKGISLNERGDFLL